MDAYLSLLERARANPSIMILKKIAAALQMLVANFFLGRELDEIQVVLKEEERVNINFKREDAKIQVLDRDIQHKRMQPFYTTIDPGEARKGLPPMWERSLESFFKDSLILT